MKRIERLSLVTMLLALLGLSACQGADDEGATVASAPDAVVAVPGTAGGDAGSVSQGKPTAPISMNYEVLGNPIVGQPVLINVVVSSSQGPVSVQYSITDGSAVAFQQGQVERLEIADPSSGAVQQLAVIPQREGRVYVNVSAEVETPSGAMIRSIAIPIKVGSAPEQPTINGELKEGPDGETVISMPARQSN